MNKNDIEISFLLVNKTNNYSLFHF
jgi:hypothetical protein